MDDLARREKPVERIILETRSPGWVVLSIGSCGILARSLIGRHEKEYQESRRTALAFAHCVLQMMSSAHENGQNSTPQILIDAADEVISDPDHVFVLGTTWQYLSEGVEVCSVGSSSVLTFEKETIQEVIAPHTVVERLKSQGKAIDSTYWNAVTHVLGSRRSEKSCGLSDVRGAIIPLLPTTTLAIIVNRLLVDDILQRNVSGIELSSFIEEWKPPGKKMSTSVLISW